MPSVHKGDVTAQPVRRQSTPTTNGRQTKEQTMPYLPPVFLDINVSPVTNVATVTQTANAFSIGSLSSVAVASNVASITQ
jgi:hypothetical protein